ncbi:MAG: glycine zipper family protein [Pelistega sp.]|nr:glycine zipper family protein [Pelistega sp.]
MKLMKYSMVAILATTTLAACSSYRPIVDSKGQDMTRYEQDLKECQALADQVSPTGNAALGAGISAALGAAIGAIAGNSSSAAIGAGIGAVSGGAGGGLSGADKQKSVIQQCLAGRGYRVLG